MSAQMTIGSMSGAKIAAAPSAVLIVYAGALLQGMTLVSFPAVSAMSSKPVHPSASRDIRQRLDKQPSYIG